MLKRVGFTAALVAAMMAMPVLTASAADLPKGEEVIDKYLEAIGGKDKAVAFKNRVMKGTFSLVDMGMNATFTRYVATPNMVTEIVIEGMGTAQMGVKDGTAWQSIPAMGQMGIVEGDEAAGLLRQTELEELANWKKYFESAETVSEEAVGEATCYKVTLTPKEGSPVSFYFDKETGLAVQSEATEQGATAVTSLSDYKEVDGIKLAHKMDTTGMMNISIVLETIEHNQDVPADKFDIPAEVTGGAADAAPAEGAETGTE